MSSNLNSKLFRFHCVRPNEGKYINRLFKKKKQAKMTLRSFFPGALILILNNAMLLKRYAGIYKSGSGGLWSF